MLLVCDMYITHFLLSGHSVVAGSVCAGTLRRSEQQTTTCTVQCGRVKQDLKAADFHAAVACDCDNAQRVTMLMHARTVQHAGKACSRKRAVYCSAC